MMKNRPNPEVFAYYSYRLAYVSSGIVLFAIAQVNASCKITT